MLVDKDTSGLKIVFSYDYSLFLYVNSLVLLWGDTMNQPAPKNHSTHSSNKYEKDTNPSNDSNVSEANYAKVLLKFLPKLFIAVESFESGVGVVYTKTLNRISALVLGISTFVLTLIILAFDFCSGNYNLIIPLFLFCIPSIFSLCWLLNKDRNPTVSLAVLGGSVTLLFGYLLVYHASADGSTMLWIAVFPLVMVLTLGLRFGAYVFALIYLFMILLFNTSLGSFLAVPISNAMQTKLLIVCLGGFCFIWCFEFARYKTNLALLVAAYRIEQNSFTDALTGLGNRRDFDRSLIWTMARVERTALPFALAIIDIDHFKKVNDTYGHAVGDEVLKFLAREVKEQIRTADRIFRWGGEEFAVIMPATGMERAIVGAERVREHIEHSPVILKDIKISITISVGIYSGLESKDCSLPLKIADACLYEAKETGRNKVVGKIATEEEIHNQENID